MPTANMGMAPGNEADLAASLKLRPDQLVLFAQTVGYPAKS